MKEWINECMNSDWMNEWTNERTKERTNMNDWTNEQFIQCRGSKIATKPLIKWNAEKVTEHKDGSGITKICNRNIKNYVQKSIKTI